MEAKSLSRRVLGLLEEQQEGQFTQEKQTKGRKILGSEIRVQKGALIWRS